MLISVPHDEQWIWLQFYSEGEGHPVQEWLNELKERYPDHFWAIKDQLAQMQITPFSEWEDERLFDPLEGEGGISEIRVVPPIDEGGRSFHYRIYGFANEDRVSYTFLHGSDKLRRNDKLGKSIAQRRLAQLRSQEAEEREISLD